MDTDAHEWESDLTEVVIGAAHQLPEAKGGMETSPPGSLISYVTLATVLSSYFVDTTLDNPRCL